MLLERRRAGVLLHPTSLPGPERAGDIGSAARRFVDWLAEARQRIWQLLPLGPTGAGDSPYSSPSAFAGHPGLIARDGLVEDGLLRPRTATNRLATAANVVSDRAELATALRDRREMLHHAWCEFRRAAPRELRVAFESFVDAPGSSFWLDDWALYAALRERSGGRAWVDWPDGLRRREPAALRRAFDELADHVGFERFVQFVFDRQWRALREYAVERGVTILGDMPFYVAHESADVWAHSDRFLLDRGGRPTHVAGVPPDYFSETGQLWGNPIFDWEALAADGYRWWIERVRSALQRTSLVRLDHFRAFSAYWEVAAQETTALDGRWRPGAGRALFEAIERAIGELPFVAEDLGEIDDDVRRLRDDLGLPGMRIVQFGLLDAGSEHDPACYTSHVAAYTGTHDNAPIRGWLDALDDADRDRALDRLGHDPRRAAWRAVELAWRSPAALAIAPMQDLLGLDDSARMNLPGVAGGNWGWRLGPAGLEGGLASRLAELTAESERT